MKRRPKSLKFFKYSALGNHFCLIDETEGVIIPEEDKLFFAQEYANPQYGIGCDSILFIQAPGPEVLSQLRQRFGKIWSQNKVEKKIAQIIGENKFKAQAIMRIFEPCGQESAMCGNGIRCVADYLCHKWNLKKVRILAEVTTLEPKIYEVSKGFYPGYYRLRTERPGIIPSQFKGPKYDQYARPVDNFAEVLEIPIAKELSGIWSSDKLICYVIYTGEPHLVCFVSSDQAIQKRLGLPKNQFPDYFSRSEGYRTRILQTLGHYLNDREPVNSSLGLVNKAEGINVNIAEVHPEKALINMRVYERGIWGKTKACGTGALAVAALAMFLGLVKENRVRVLPEGSFYCNQGSVLVPGYIRRCGELIIEREDKDWFLIGPVERVYQGQIRYWQEALKRRRKEIEIYSARGERLDQKIFEQLAA